MMVEMNGDLKWKADEAIDEAYRRGYEDGKKAELAELKTIKIKMPNDDGVGMIEKIKDLIRECEKIDAYTLSFPAWKLVNKLKKIVGFELEDYEEPQTDEIKVGDEVRDKYNPYPRVVTSINEQDMADLIDARGNAYSDSVFCLKKTGRHFPQIAEVLEQMRKESE